jgi:hypothetical protein
MKQKIHLFFLSQNNPTQPKEKPLRKKGSKIDGIPSENMHSTP